MPKLVEARLLDFGGGLNDGVSPSEIAPNQLSNLRNFYPYRTHLKRRLGRKRLTNTALGAEITGLFALKLSTGVWALLCGKGVGFSKLSGTTFASLTGTAIATSTKLWAFAQYKDIAYAVRSDLLGIKRMDEAAFSDAGIDKPSTSPTLTGVPAGLVDAGGYYGVVTFVNTDTDIESNPCDPSALCTLAADGTINWTSIPVSTNAQVNARRLYRTLPDQTGEYYLVATIPDNSTTTYADNAPIDDLGVQASFRNGLPPTEYLSALASWRERMWAISTRSLFFSEEFLPECFAASAEIQITPDDGHELRGIKAFGDRLVWGKTNSIGFIVGVGPEDFTVQVLDDRHGVIARSSLQVAEGFIFWYSGQNVFMSDGSSVRDISDPKIRAVLDTIPEANKELVQGAIYPRLGLYLLSVRAGSSSETKLLVYNYREQSWTTWDYAGVAPSVMGDFFDAELEPRIYAVFSGVQHVFDLTDEDQMQDDAASAASAAADMTCSFRTRALDFNQPGKLHAVKRVSILCDNVGVNSTMRLYRDIESSASKTRTVPLYSNNARRWKRCALSEMERKSYQTQFELEYTGTQDLTVEGLTIEAAVWNWKDQPQ